MTLSFVLILLTLTGLTVSAVFFFGWAARSGQFRDLNAGAKTVFSPDEPEGKPSDSFPNQERPKL